MLASSQSPSPSYSAASSPRHSFHARPYNVSHSPRLSRRPSQQQIASAHRSAGLPASKDPIFVHSASQTSPTLRRMVDAATQYSPPETGSPVSIRKIESHSQVKPAASAPELLRTPGKRRAESGSPPAPTLPHSPLQPNPRIDPEPVADIPTSPQDVVAQQPVTPSNQPRPAAPKRPRPSAPAMKAMPPRYENCDVRDLGNIIADMLMELVRTNDAIPLQDGGLTRFHSR